MKKPENQAQKTYHHGNLRDALLQTARALLEERGPSFLSLREIARRVGVSAPAAYHHFPNLEAIALGLAEQGASELSAALSAAANGDKTGELASGEAYVNFAIQNPALYRLMFGEGLSQSSRASGATAKLRQYFLKFMDEKTAAGFSLDAAKNQALFLWSLTHGLSLLMIDQQINPEDGTTNQIHEILKLAGHGISPDPD